MSYQCILFFYPRIIILVMSYALMNQYKFVLESNTFWILCLKLKFIYQILPFLRSTFRFACSKISRQIIWISFFIYLCEKMNSNV